MSLRIDNNELITGAYVIGNTGLGVVAENSPSAGLSGPSYLYNDLSLPADNGKEIMGRITRWPTLGVFAPDEDGSFIYSGDSDYAEYQLIVDGIVSIDDIGYGPGIARITLSLSSAEISGTIEIDSILSSGVFSIAAVLGGNSQLLSFLSSGVMASATSVLSGGTSLDDIVASGLMSAPSILSGDLDISEFIAAGGLTYNAALSDSEMRQMFIWVNDLAKIHGLILGESLQVSQTQRIAADIVQKISGTPDNVVVTRQ